MKIHGATQAVIVKYALIGGAIIGAAYYLKSYLKGSSIVDGLSNPIESLGALVGIMPENKSTVTLSDNFKYYIELNGGMDKYILQHKNGTWKAPAYDAAMDYKKLYQQKTLSPFFL